MFLTKPYKILLSLNGKPGQKTTKTSLGVCSMPKTFLKEVMGAISSFIACSVAPKLLIHHPDTKYIRKLKNVIRYNLRIFEYF